MINTYVMRDGTGDARCANHGPIPLGLLRELLRGRSLSKPSESLPVVNGHHGQANELAGFDRVLIVVTDPAEAMLLKAVTQRYHLLRDLTPAQLIGASAALR